LYCLHGRAVIDPSKTHTLAHSVTLSARLGARVGTHRLAWARRPKTVWPVWPETVSALACLRHLRACHHCTRRCISFLSSLGVNCATCARCLSDSDCQKLTLTVVRIFASLSAPSLSRALYNLRESTVSSFVTESPLIWGMPGTKMGSGPQTSTQLSAAACGSLCHGRTWSNGPFEEHL
jgi:hypothetical protein